MASYLQMPRHGADRLRPGIGTAAALALARLVAAMLVHVGAADPMAFGAAALFLSAVALLASYVPARRAMRINPADALRCQ